MRNLFLLDRMKNIFDRKSGFRTFLFLDFKKLTSAAFFHSFVLPRLILSLAFIRIDERYAQRAINAINNSYFFGKTIKVQFSKHNQGQDRHQARVLTPRSLLQFPLALNRE